jgi:hypothetical protein
VVVLLTSHDNKGVLAYFSAPVTQATSGKVLAIAPKDTGIFRVRRTLNFDGRNTGDRRQWSMKQERRTPGYTTDWDGLALVRA